MAATKSHVPHVGFLVFLENSHTIEEHAVLEKFSWIADIIENFHSYRPRFYKVREDPRNVVQIAGWDSVDQHYRAFHTSSRMGPTLHEFGEVLDIRSNWHANIAFRDLDIEAPTQTLGRFFVFNAAKAEFSAALPDWLTDIARKSGTKASAGWRCDGGWNDQDDATDHFRNHEVLLAQVQSQDAVDAEDTTEWDMVIPWPSIEKWQEVTGNEKAMMPFFDLLMYVARIEVLHLDPLLLPPVDKSRASKHYDESDDDEYNDEETDEEYDG